MTLKLNQHAGRRLHEAERADLSLAVRMDCAGETVAGRDPPPAKAPEIMEKI